MAEAHAEIAPTLEEGLIGVEDIRPRDQDNLPAWGFALSEQEFEWVPFLGDLENDPAPNCFAYHYYKINAAFSATGTNPYGSADAMLTAVVTHGEYQYSEGDYPNPTLEDENKRSHYKNLPPEYGSVGQEANLDTNSWQWVPDGYDTDDDMIADLYTVKIKAGMSLQNSANAVASHPSSGSGSSGANNITTVGLDVGPVTW